MTEERSTSTRERILDAAEAIFMAHGYEGASMRQITSEAGVNLAAGNYHFGAKEGLFHAVLKRRLDLLNQERLRVLDELEAKANGAPLKPSQIVDAFFGTLLRMASEEGSGGHVFLRLIGRTLTEPAGVIPARRDVPDAPAGGRFIGAARVGRKGFPVNPGDGREGLDNHRAGRPADRADADARHVEIGRLPFLRSLGGRRSPQRQTQGYEPDQANPYPHGLSS
jgi:AcrR family transcriptional regulator